jgi:ERCC4-type nuclease
VIWVTTAANDQDLRDYIKRDLGNRVQFKDLEVGDVQIYGKWIGNAPAKRLAERKKLGDLIKCIQDGRYIFQWQRAYEAGWKEQYLFAEIEDKYRENPRTGLIEVRHGKDWVEFRPRFMWHRLDTFLYEVSEHLGVNVERTKSPAQTAKRIVRLYMLFQRSPEEHKQLQKIFVPPKPAENLLTDMFKSPSLTRKIAAQLPHIGWELSKAAEDKFGTSRALINATEEEWMEIPKVGKKIAQDIIKGLEEDCRDGKSRAAREAGNIEDLTY